jgi:hypothetical protein
VNTHARLVSEAQSLAGLHVRHQPLESVDALAERRELRLGVFLEALVPAFAQIGTAYIANELEDDLFRSLGFEDGVGLFGGRGEIESGDIDIDLQKGRGSCALLLLRRGAFLSRHSRRASGASGPI